MPLLATDSRTEASMMPSNRPHAAAIVPAATADDALRRDHYEVGANIDAMSYGGRYLAIDNFVSP